MQQILRIWWPIFVAMALIQAGNGITGTLISVTSEARDFAPWLKGLVLSAFYAGSAAGALVAPAAIARSTHVASVAGFILMAVAATAGYALSGEPLVWVFLRFMAGFGLSGAFAAVESWLNLGTKDDWRARVFSIYLMVQLGGLAAGQLFLNARGLGLELLFLIAAVLTFSAVVFLRFEVVENPHFEAPKKMGLNSLFRRSPFGVSAVVLSGYAWAAMMASGPALVEQIGLSDFSKSMFMTLAVVSGVVAQFPIASMADHRDRRLVLAAMAGAAALASCAGLVDGEAALMVFAAAFGAATFPLYAVGVARVSERLEQSERTAASASMIVFFLLGAIVAPPILSYAIALFGPQAYFVVLALPHLVFAIAAVLSARPKITHSS
jgi:MFS family permease